jgi:hypothetical protein
MSKTHIHPMKIRCCGVLTVQYLLKKGSFKGINISEFTVE